MNSTKWKSLSEFIWHLDRSKLIKAEEVASQENGCDPKIYISTLSDISSVCERMRAKISQPHKEGTGLEHLAITQARLYNTTPTGEAKEQPLSPSIIGIKASQPEEDNNGERPKISFKLCRPDKRIKFA